VAVLLNGTLHRHTSPLLPFDTQCRGAGRMPGGESSGYPPLEAAWLLATTGTMPNAPLIPGRKWVETAFRRAAKNLHPDAGGTDLDLFLQITQARDYLLSGK